MTTPYMGSYRERIDESGEVIEERQCTICLEWKPLKAFYKHKRSGYETNCKACKPALMAQKTQAEAALIRTITAKIDDALPTREESFSYFLELVQPHMTELIEELVSMAKNAEKDGDRLKAISYIMDRVLGKADQQITVKQETSSKADEFLDLWSNPTIIDVTPIEGESHVRLD